jgi:hypothetical protein
MGVVGAELSDTRFLYGEGYERAVKTWLVGRNGFFYKEDHDEKNNL